MNTPRILWLFAVSLLLSPTALFAQNFDAYGFAFDAGNTSHCWVKNVSDHAMVKGCLVQGMLNPGNPTDDGHQVSSLLLPGEIQELTYAVHRPACTPEQFDGLDNLLPWQMAIDRWTESDIANNHASALGVMLPPDSVCRNPPSPPEPPPPPPPACVSPGSFSFGGSPTIARFPEGFVNPWFPEFIGPFYWWVPPGTYHITMWTGDDHVDQPTRGIIGKYDGPQDERGTLVFDSGDVIGPTNDVPDDQNKAFTDFGTRALSGFTRFWFVHAAPANPPEPTGSFYPIALTFTCVEGGQ